MYEPTSAPTKKPTRDPTRRPTNRPTNRPTYTNTPILNSCVKFKNIGRNKYIYKQPSFQLKALSSGSSADRSFQITNFLFFNNNI